MEKQDIVDYVLRTPGNTNPAVLDGMLDDVGEKLPKVTNEDNGKVLAVAEGVWDKVELGGGIIIINAVAAKNESSYIVTADKTYEDVIAAYTEGKMIIVRGKVDFEGIGEDYQDYWPIRDYIMQEAPRPNSVAFVFSALAKESNAIVNCTFTVSTSQWLFQVEQW